MLLRNPLSFQPLDLKLFFCFHEHFIKIYKMITACSVATAPSSTLSTSSECRKGKHSEKPSSRNTFIPPKTLAANSDAFNGSEYN